MESLSETTWDVVICGTGLQQSLLALALSRSDKKILHVDPNEYYGGTEAAFSLQEADAWASEIATASAPAAAAAIFTSPAVTRPPPPPDESADAGATLANSRSYSLSLSPQLLHANSALLSQLVSSRAYRQLEFLAVGSFFVFKPPPPPPPPCLDSDSHPDPSSAPRPTLTRIPSTREDVFSSTTLPARAKRQLMKFLKLVLSHKDQDEAQAQLASPPPPWHEYADRPLASFLADKMGLDAELRTYITTLTLSLDGEISTRDGLGTIHRHLTSMGLFGPGFAAVYPKWGGSSEIAQVACRAGAVGGGVYMLGTGIRAVVKDDEDDELVKVELSDDTVVKAKMLVRGSEEVPKGGDDVTRVSRTVAIVGSPLSVLFETTMEGAPTPAVAVIALPPGTVKTVDGTASKYPVYAIAHSSDTGECPAGQSVLYLSTIQTPESKALLENTTSALLAALAPQDGPAPRCLYQLYYEQQSSNTSTLSGEGRILDFPTLPVSLTFDDATLDPVREVWRRAMGEAAEEDDVQYMVFADREGMDNDDEYE